MTRRALARYAVEALIAGQPITKVAKHLAAALIEAGREKEAGLLLNDINWELEDRGQLAQAKVTSATPLADQLVKELRAKIKAATKVNNVSIESEVDKSVIGGLKVETATRLWDQTVKRKLADLREAF